jgi:hypothetical protein
MRAMLRLSWMVPSVAALLVAWPASAFAQAPTAGTANAADPARVATTLTPLRPPTPRARPNGIHADLGLGVIGVGYERVVSPQLSLQVSGHYYRPWYTGTPVQGAGAELRVYVFPFTPAPGGWYLSPFARVDYVTATIDGATGSGVGGSFGAVIGYSFVIRDVVVLRVGFGMQYFAYDLTAGATQLSAQTYYPMIDLGIGVAL